jgi:hypothetical protein
VVAVILTTEHYAIAMEEGESGFHLHTQSRHIWTSAQIARQEQQDDKDCDRQGAYGGHPPVGRKSTHSTLRVLPE